MPLPAPDCVRSTSHQRSITIRARSRTDGLSDIEGRLTDAWHEPVPMAGGMLPVGEPMHSMWLRLNVDRTATIVAAQTVTDAGPMSSFFMAGQKPTTSCINSSAIQEP
jgi:hypothetical protein